MSCEGEKIPEKPEIKKGPVNIRRAIDQFRRMMATGYYASETGEKVYCQPYHPEEPVSMPGDRLIATIIFDHDAQTIRYERPQTDQPQEEKL